MKEYEQIEQQIKNEFEKIECQPFEEVLANIKPKLINKEKEKKQNSLFNRRLVSFAVCFVFLLMVIGLNYLIGDSMNNEDIKYVDNDIIQIDSDMDFINSRNIINIFDFRLISEVEVKIGQHRETEELVYFKIWGINENQNELRIITIKVIVKSNYEQMSEWTYKTGNILNISNYQVNCLDRGYNDPFHEYTLGFKLDNVRYYIDYQTINQNDAELFFNTFLY